MVTRALSLKAFGTPQNLLQRPPRDQFWYCTAGVRVPLPAGSEGVPSSCEQHGMAPARSGCCFARFRALDAGAGVCLVSVSLPESLSDTTERRGELCHPGTVRRLPSASCAGLWQARLRTQREGQSECHAWPGGATGDRSMVGSRSARLRACG